MCRLAVTEALRARYLESARDYFTWICEDAIRKYEKSLLEQGYRYRLPQQPDRPASTGPNLSAEETRELRSLYRRLALIYHPDRQSAEGAHDHFIAITQMYENGDLPGLRALAGGQQPDDSQGPTAHDPLPQIPKIKLLGQEYDLTDELVTDLQLSGWYRHFQGKEEVCGRQYHSREELVAHLDREIRYATSMLKLTRDPVASAALGSWIERCRIYLDNPELCLSLGRNV